MPAFRRAPCTINTLQRRPRRAYGPRHSDSAELIFRPAKSIFPMLCSFFRIHLLQSLLFPLAVGLSLPPAPPSANFPIEFPSRSRRALSVDNRSALPHVIPNRPYRGRVRNLLFAVWFLLLDRGGRVALRFFAAFAVTGRFGRRCQLCW